jgi:hypothetical protein
MFDLVSIDSRNWNKAGNGGAIRAAAGSKVSLYYSDFVNNRAPDGGAMYNLGTTEIEESNFQHNEATNGNVSLNGEVIWNDESMCFLTNTSSHIIMNLSIFDREVPSFREKTQSLMWQLVHLIVIWLFFTGQQFLMVRQ